MAKKRVKKGPVVDPEYLQKQKASLLRKNRQVLYFNESEMDAINAYMSRFKVRSKSSLLREIIIEKILSELEDNHPTLF